MDKSKLIKIGGLVLTIIGAIVGLASDKLEDMKGFEIPEDFYLCSECSDWASDAEMQFGSDRYSRR